MKLMQYVTKLATPAKLANYFRFRPLLAKPDEYIARMDALVGVSVDDRPFLERAAAQSLHRSCCLFF
jgi:hypothetical protein